MIEALLSSASGLEAPLSLFLEAAEFAVGVAD